MKCHMCDAETDWVCRDCDQPVCEDCVVQMTYHNQIDYTLCTECYDNAAATDYLIRAKEWKEEEAIAAKKEIRRKARQKAYWKPEAVEKRRLAKIAKRKAAIELHNKQAMAAMKTVADMFRGMF